MDILHNFHDRLFFQIFPYVALITFFVMTIQRWKSKAFKYSRLSSQFQENQQPLWGFVPLHWGIITLLTAHVIWFLLPETVLWWNRVLLRLYIMEIAMFIFALMTLIGLINIIYRNVRTQCVMTPPDWLGLALITFQILTGIFTAYFHRWGSNLFAASLAPYLWSVFKLSPNLSYLAAMPIIIKFHIIGAFSLILLFPFSRLLHILVLPNPHLWRELLKIIVKPRIKEQINIITLFVAIIGLFVIISNSAYHLPGNQEGYQPIQPIDFSHQLHAGDMEISCQYCHSGASQSKHAGIPAINTCMTCHKYVSATKDDLRLEEEQASKEGREIRPISSSEITKIYTAMGYDQEGNPIEGKKGTSVEWVKVHNVPDFVFFSHMPHITAGMDCSECHGDVASMKHVKQEENLSMGWCLSCHRKVNELDGVAWEKNQSLLNCSTCHY